MNPEDLRQSVELRAVELIKGGLESGTISEARAQELSQIVLDTIHPGMSLEELYRAIPKLDDTAPELSPVVLPVVRQYEETYGIKAVEDVRALIRTGQYDAAVKHAKDTISRKPTVEHFGSSNAKRDT